MLKKVLCQVCGCNALEKRPDGFYACPACGQVYEDKEVEGDREKDIELWSAFDWLRKNDFDEAHDLFSSVLAKDKKAHRAYLGRALADNSISFLENSSGKKIPICHNISEKSFHQNDDFNNALKYAPNEICVAYQSMADYIDRIRKEWIEKASKEKPYDVFICYKDKEEDGTTRTRDSYDVSELCSELEKQNLNVFCARRSLMNKVSEQFEPYIYNALKTATAMIVYGSNPDYFRSAWVKNEWNRFLKLIELKQKDEKSLIIVYNGVNVSDLPEKLRIRQCMDKNSLTFFNDLMRHIGKLVYKNSYAAAVLPKIEIKRQTFQPKNTIIANGNVPTKQFATESTISENAISDNRLLNVRRFIENELKEEAISVIQDLLSEDPHNYKALYYQFLVENDLWGSKPVIESDLKKIKSYETIDRILSCCSLKFAYAFLDKLYRLALRLAKEKSSIAVELLKRILPYKYTVSTKEYGTKEEYIKAIFEIAIHSLNEDLFELLITTLSSKEVDRYVSLNRKFACELLSQKKYIQSKCYFEKVLSVDGGDIVSLRGKIKSIINDNTSPDEGAYLGEERLMSNLPSQEFKTLLSVLSTFDAQKEVVACLIGFTGKNVKSTNIELFFSKFKDVLQYYTGALKDIGDTILAVGQIAMSQSFFDGAFYCNALCINYGYYTPEVLWSIIMAKAKVSTERELIAADFDISVSQEFSNLMAMENLTKSQMFRYSFIVKLQKEYRKLLQEKTMMTEQSKE